LIGMALKAFVGEEVGAKRGRPRWGVRGIDCMDLGDQLGSGTFGVVYKALDNGVPVALKKIKMERQSQGFPVTSIREMKILKTLKHDNIVMLHDIITFNKEGEGNEYEQKGIADGDIFMVFEYVDYDLFGVLKSPSVKLTSMHIRSYMKQLLSGVESMHRAGILHRDIKSANILVTSDNVIKIADWGLARLFHKENTRMTKEVCTLWYRSPELLMGVKTYGPEIDIWSVGCIFGEIVARQAILPGDSVARQLELVQQLCGTPTGELRSKYEKMLDWDKYPFTTEHPPRLRRRFENFDALGVSFMEKLLDLDFSTRITAKDAIEDEFFFLESVGGQKRLVDLPRPQDLPRFGNIEFPREGDSKRKDEETRTRLRAEAELAEMAAAAAAAAAAQAAAHVAAGLGPIPMKRKSSQNLSKYKVIGPDDEGEEGEVADN
jgi:serine/threonine protein kinase